MTYRQLVIREREASLKGIPVVLGIIVVGWLGAAGMLVGSVRNQAEAFEPRRR